MQGDAVEEVTGMADGKIGMVVVRGNSIVQVKNLCTLFRVLMFICMYEYLNIHIHINLCLCKCIYI
jgi:N12 class adenine-specific DNA methylase